MVVGTFPGSSTGAVKGSRYCETRLQAGLFVACSEGKRHPDKCVCKVSDLKRFERKRIGLWFSARLAPLGPKPGHQQTEWVETQNRGSKVWKRRRGFYYREKIPLIL